MNKKPANNRGDCRSKNDDTGASWEPIPPGDDPDCPFGPCDAACRRRRQPDGRFMFRCSLPGDPRHTLSTFSGPRK